MYGLSTSWKSRIITNGLQLFNELQKTGIPGLELEYRITKEMFNEFKQALKKKFL